MKSLIMILIVLIVMAADCGLVVVDESNYVVLVGLLLAIELLLKKQAEADWQVNCQYHRQNYQYDCLVGRIQAVLFRDRLLISNPEIPDYQLNLHRYIKDPYSLRLHGYRYND